MTIKRHLVGILSFSSIALASGSWSFSETTAGALYQEYKIKSGDDHFAPYESPYDGLKALTRFDATYTLPTPLGEHWLLKDSELAFTASFELSPITALPMVGLDFTPVPFLVFGMGGSLGSGWNMLGFEGLTQYDFQTEDYENLTPFTHYYYDFFLSGTFQFDTGALIGGDWSHVILLASYKAKYAALSGMDDGDIWQWKETALCANGWQYDVVGLLGYQMPLVLNMVGVMAEFYGHYDPKDYGAVANSLDGNFMSVELSLLLTFQLNERNSLTTLISFDRYRSYETIHDDEDEEPLLKTTGAEWSFYAIYFSWAHEF